MPRLFVLLLGLLIISFVYYIIIWFILNQQNAFIWPWWVKCIYIIMIWGSWGNFSDNLKDDNY